MTDTTDRDALATLITAHDADRMECHDHLGLCCPTNGCSHGYKHSAEHQADAILTSDWLATYVRDKQAEAVEEVGRLIDESGVRTDSAERWGIITALHIVRDRADWLRDRADRIDNS